MDLKKYVREIPDFPIPGVLFRDITTVLKDPAALRGSVDAMIDAAAGLSFDIIVGPESRGFIFGMPMAYALNVGFVPVRKEGKLPSAVVRKEYTLEYGSAAIEVHRDAILPGQRILVVDDLLATGGTAKAIADLAADLGAVIAGYVFFLELSDLGGRSLLDEFDIRSVCLY